MNKPAPAVAIPSEEVARTLETGRTLFPGFRCVDTLSDLDDDEYESEEESYLVLDLGATMDSRTLQTEAAYQLIGMDTPMPFFRVGEHIFQGKVAPLIGDEVVFDVVRHEDDPQTARYQPILKTNARVQMRGVTLEPRGMLRDAEPGVQLARGMFPARPRRLPETKAKGEPGETPGATPQAPSPSKPFSMYDDDVETPRRPGRTANYTTYPVSTLSDLADIANAGGLGDLRLEIAQDATPDLLAAVSSVRGGKEWVHGTVLSRAQEERLVLNLPASGPGSRGGKSGRKSGGGRGRPRGRPSVPAGGEGLADGFLGLGGVWAPTEPAEPEPMQVDSDDELRELGEGEE